MAARTFKLEAVAATVHEALRGQVERINALNVYPVPDGDTGTNMLLTLQSVLGEVSGREYDSSEAAAKDVSRAALMGARGNSGVILSQILRGACDVLESADTFDAETFASALGRARDRAYSAIRQPVEGTMLTVIKDAANAAENAVAADSINRSDDGDDLASVIAAAAREAHSSVQRTPQLLDVLRDAGVVDAGGLGIAVALDGLHSFVTGEEVSVARDVDLSVEPTELPGHDEEAWGYCTEFIVAGFAGDHEPFRDYIHEIGESVLVVSDDDLVKVHLHTQDPGGAMSYAGQYGRLMGVKVDDMEAQTRERRNSRGEARGESSAGGAASLANGADPPVVPAALGVVVASRGAGSRALYESMGAVVVEGGQGANPSAADLAAAAKRCGAEEVILLPNNKNIIPTANQVGGLVNFPVHVVETQSIASGLAAMVVFDPEEEPQEVIEEMREVVAGARCAEITRSVREAKVNGHVVPEGAYIGLLDGSLEFVDESVEETALQLARQMLEGGADILTLLRGEDLDTGAAASLAQRIRELDPEVDVELKDGDQPLYPLQMVAE